MSAYWQLLRDPRWQRKRLEVMSAAEFRCQRCFSGNKTLNVHHRIYRKNAKPWEYDLADLICLCEDCHEIHHKWRSRIEMVLAQLDPESIEKLAGYALGLLAMQNAFDEMQWPENPDAHQKTYALLSHQEAAGFLDSILPSDTETSAAIAVLDAQPLSIREVFAIATKRCEPQDLPPVKGAH